MRCMRSGYCCVWCLVVIPVEDRLKAKLPGVVCPHLEFQSEGAFCKVHDEPWYKFTSCYSHGNGEIDPDHRGNNRPCAYGVWTKENILKRTIENVVLEDCGPFVWSEAEGIFQSI